MTNKKNIDRSMPDALLSYAHIDDDEHGDLTWLRKKLEMSAHQLTGIPFVIFQDVHDLETGDTWDEKLQMVLESAQILIPILTPSYFTSDYCRREAEVFLSIEGQADCDGLILPIYFTKTERFEDSAERANDELAAKLYKRQYDDWRELKYKLRKRGTRRRIDGFAEILTRASARSATTKARSVFGARLSKTDMCRDRLKVADTVKGGEDQTNLSIDWQRGSKETTRVASSKSLLRYLRAAIKSRRTDPGYFEPRPDTTREIREPRGSCEQSVGIHEFVDQNVEERLEKIEKLQQRPPWLPWLVGLCLAILLSAVALGVTLFSSTLSFDQKKLGSVASEQRNQDAPIADYSNDTLRDCNECPEMLVLPTGSFLMGSSDDEPGRGNDEGPQRQVTIRYPFAIGKYEVTRAQFEIFATETGYDATGCRYSDGNEWENDADRSWRDPGFDQTGDHPVTCVSWEDAQAYASWLSRRTGEDYRLPSEAEWEYAARAGTTTPYLWGEQLSASCNYANGRDETGRRVNKSRLRSFFPCDDGYAQTAPVGTFEPNAFGLNDTLGNVWEWVEDRAHDDYLGAPSDGSPWKEGTDLWRINRGGAWSHIPKELRSANRRALPPDERNFGLGFRVARTLRHDQEN